MRHFKTGAAYGHKKAPFVLANIVFMRIELRSTDIAVESQSSEHAACSGVYSCESHTRIPEPSFISQTPADPGVAPGWDPRVCPEIGPWGRHPFMLRDQNEPGHPPAVMATCTETDLYPVP